MASGFPITEKRMGKFQESKHKAKQNMWIQWTGNIGENHLKDACDWKRERRLSSFVIHL